MTESARTVEIPADQIEAIEFYAEDTGLSFDEIAQLMLTQGVAAYTQGRQDDGQRYFAAPNA